MPMRPIVRVLAGVAAGAVLLTACGDDDPSSADGFQLVADGTLTVCSDIPYEPFEYEDPSSPLGYSGFDIDLIAAVAEEIGLDVAIVATGFEGLTSGATMAAGTCDLAASAMTITAARAENIDFSVPYYDAVQSLLVLTDSDITGIDDLVAGVRVGVQSGTTGEAYAQDNVPGGEIVSFENPGDLFIALEAGQLEAILQDQPVNVEYARQNDSATVVAEFDTAEQYGFAMEKDRGDGLVEAVDAALAALRADGTYDEIYDRYFAVD
jgi:polar amino acid transport system substrate-binding protein